MDLSQPIPQLKHRAKRLSRSEGIPLHAALDEIARQEGFPTWSLLSARVAPLTLGGRLLARLSPGDFMLLGGRPGQGKTRLGLELVAEAAKSGRSAALFTLEFTERKAAEHLRQLGADPASLGGRLRVDASDGINSSHIVRALAQSGAGTVVVIDYLQVLDQRRETPPLAGQVESLSGLTRERNLIMICLSQVDRLFDESGRQMPGLEDVRLPNPVDLSLFTRACFVHGNQFAFAEL